MLTTLSCVRVMFGMVKKCLMGQPDFSDMRTHLNHICIFLMVVIVVEILLAKSVDACNY
jgi:hypothetical protein